jgi:signal recognition particle subunit SRP54
MFETLTNNFSKIINRLTGAGKISDQDLDRTLGEINSVLIDADVALPVVKEFIENIKTKAKGQEVLKSVTPGQMIVKIINDEMIAVLSCQEGEEKINLSKNGLTSILMVGLQGSGKTTSTAKLAVFFKKQNKKVLLVSSDTYRPAARQQLEILSNAIDGVDFFQTPSNDPLEIAKQGFQEAKRSRYDVVLFDTAGRLEIDQEMIREIKEIKQICQPKEILLVIDSLSGQSALQIASEFNNQLGISGSILTRVDGDGRSGAILSTKYITQKPIKFLGTGEKTDALESFDPKRIAGRILGMGDIVSLVEKAASIISKEEAEKASERLQKGIFTLIDYLDQIRSVKKLGGVGKIAQMLPDMNGLRDKMRSSNIEERFGTKQEAIILSMSKKEKKNPAILNASRKKRIANGSGTSIADVQKLLKHFDEMQVMMKKASKMNLSSLLGKSGFGGLFS